jgi:hypothetical protein
VIRDSPSLPAPREIAHFALRKIVEKEMDRGNATVPHDDTIGSRISWSSWKISPIAARRRTGERAACVSSRRPCCKNKSDQVPTPLEISARQRPGTLGVCLASCVSTQVSALTPEIRRSTSATGLIIQGVASVGQEMRKGYNVSVVQNPTISLADDVAVRKRVIAAQTGPVVLGRPLVRRCSRNGSGQRPESGGTRLHCRVRSGCGRVHPNADSESPSRRAGPSDSATARRLSASRSNRTEATKAYDIGTPRCLRGKARERCYFDPSKKADQG